MDITPSSHSNNMPAHCISLTHAKTRQIAVYVSINGLHLIALYKSAVRFQLFGSRRIVGEALNVLI